MDHFSYLGIDWGEKKVGFAIADSETKIPLALVTLPNNATLLNSIMKIVDEHGVRIVVIGIPSHINRKNVVYGGERLGSLISARCGLPVRYQNEMFTTKLARIALIEKGVRHGLEAFDDQEAARIILGDFLAHQAEV